MTNCGQLQPRHNAKSQASPKLTGSKGGGPYWLAKRWPRMGRQALQSKRRSRRSKSSKPCQAAGVWPNASSGGSQT